MEIKGNSSKPAYIQIYEHVKNAIDTNILVAGDKLPSIRKLSKQLGVSTITVDNAYQQLVLEGYVYSKPRSGMIVNNIPHVTFTTGIEIDFENIAVTSQSNVLIDFHYGSIDGESFDFDTWRKLTNHVIQPTNHNYLQYDDPQGELKLRFEISKYLRTTRAALCSHENIIITSGIRQSIQLLSDITEIDSRSIAVESPGWPSAQHAFLKNGFEVHDIVLDREGIDSDQLKTKFNTKPFKFVYTTPSHQFPTGVIMSIGRRRSLLKWATRNNTYIIEDDYDSEFQYKGRPVPCLQGLDANTQVIYFGTFSKSLMPAIRVSYVILPDSLLSVYKDIKHLLGQSSSRVNQLILASFMENGHWERHLRRMRKVYLNKYETLINSIHSFFNFDYQIISGHAGLHLLIEISSNKTEDQLAQMAKDVGVKVYPASKYGYDENHSSHPLFLFGFGGLSPNEIEDGIKRLGDVWSQHSFI